MIGVYDLDLFGKTTLIKDVGEHIQQDTRTSKQVTITVVSKDLNMKKVQSKLANSLNLKFKAPTDDQKGRATELRHKFRHENKYLVILDDMWEKVDLKEVGTTTSQMQR